MADGVWDCGFCCKSFQYLKLLYKFAPITLIKLLKAQGNVMMKLCNTLMRKMSSILSLTEQTRMLGFGHQTNG